MSIALISLALFLGGDFPLNQFQVEQADELFAGLQGHYQQGTQARLAQVAWLFDNQGADPVPVSLADAQKLVRSCVLTGKSQDTHELLNYFMTCSGRNEGITFRISDARVVVGEINNPPPILLAPNPMDKK